MEQTFYFYDLETSGFNPKDARIMQFAGQRTDMSIKPIGEPDNIIIKLSEDILPEPDAVLVTGITPQKTIEEGITEAEFLKYFHENIVKPGTIFTGFNSIRFDDEFMRFLHYRNFYDPYEWEWQDNKSRWDILDVIRMTRALRPQGIVWPFDSNGVPSNRLELITEANNLSHENAHDALSDVNATIAVARTILNKQPKLFRFLVSIRSKKNVEKLINQGKPFIYTSGKYNSEYEKTTIVGILANHPFAQNASIVFDLRYDPNAFIDLSPEEIAVSMKRRSDEEGPRIPIKTLKYNRCPAVSPLSVLDDDSRVRLKINTEEINKNFQSLLENKDTLTQKITKAIEILDKKHQTKLLEDNIDADVKLYEGFFSEQDKTKMSLIRATSPNDINNLEIVFSDGRLQALLPLYIARNFPKYLSSDDRDLWEKFRQRKLLGGGVESRAMRYFNRLEELMRKKDLTSKEQYIIEELKLYGESILPMS